MKTKITADSTCDLSAALLARYQIDITPLSIVKDGVPYKDGIEIVPRDIFAHVESGAGICHTTAVNVAAYYETFRRQLKEYDAVVHINIGSKFSACNQNAHIAAAELGNVYVVDSRSLSAGMGHLALDAAILAERGTAPPEIKGILEEKAGKVEMSFVIPKIDYLHKGGRCSALTALGANILGLKPCIEVIDGKMEVGKKYRGAIRRAFESYLRDRLAGRQDIDVTSAILVHSGLSEALLVEMRNTVAQYASFETIYETVAGCTISCHCGPNTFGLMFYRK